MRGQGRGALEAPHPSALPSTQMNVDLLLMGYFGRAHGVSGEVKVFPETDDPQRFLSLEHVFVGATADETREYAIESARFQMLKGRTIALLKLDGISTREEAEALSRVGVFAAQSDLPPLADGEVFVHDMIGMEVVEEGEDEPIGTVRDVLKGAQLLIVVARDGRPDVLIPDVPAIVIDVDIENRRITVDPPEGLID